MLDAAYLRDHVEEVRARLESRGGAFENELSELAKLEAWRRRTIPQLEGLKREQNTAGDQVAQAKRQGKDASAIYAANKARAQQIKQLETELESIEGQRRRLLLTLPNVPHESVPVGTSSADNVEVRRHGQPREFDFEPAAHWDLGPALGIIDFERGVKVAGARFSV
ncbi:MAG: serine--tRNA ligase, partial [Acidobacteria bacterium]